MSWHIRKIFSFHFISFDILVRDAKVKVKEEKWLIDLQILQLV